jgi:uncharacterized protein (TIGR03086 family)
MSVPVTGNRPAEEDTVPMLDLEPATQEVCRLLDEVRDAQLGDPTPCEGYPVAALLDHIAGLSLAFTWGARKSAPPQAGPAGAPRASAENLDPGWRTVIPERLAELARAWREPAAWVGMTEVAGVSMPGETMGTVALDEVVLHGWDLARATGQEFRCDPASAQAVLAFTEAAARPEAAAMRDTLFGPVLAVPADAPVLDRALGLAGRDPAWRA